MRGTINTPSGSTSDLLYGVDNPLISVVIPVHNSEGFLDECLQSVHQQTYRNIEVILVDDDSRDGSKGIVDSWIKKDKRFHYRFVDHHNAALTRSEGIRSSVGDYICFVDSDDTVHVSYIQTLYDAIKDTVAKVASVKISSLEGWIQVSEPVIEGVSKRVERDVTKYFFSNYIWDPSGGFIAQSINAKIFTRDALRDVDYGVLNTSILEDNYILPQILAKARDGGIVLVDKNLYFYRQNDQSTMSRARSEFISYGGDLVTYADFFELTIDYAYSVLPESRGKDLLSAKLKATTHLDIARALTHDMKELNNRLNETELNNKVLLNRATDFEERNSQILQSRSFRVGNFLVAPARTLRNKFFK